MSRKAFNTDTKKTKADDKVELRKSFAQVLTANVLTSNRFKAQLTIEVHR